MSGLSARCEKGDCCVLDFPSQSNATIGIVTVTYNSERVLGDFFSSLSKQTHSTFCLYAVDNASNDRTREILSQQVDFKVRILANPENRGVAEANNQGIREALKDSCQYILLLNNDVEFPEDLLSNLLSGLESLDCDIVAPKIYYYDQPNRIWAAGGRFQLWLGRAPHIGEGALDNRQFDKVQKITYAPTCCVLIRSNVFERVGLMDPKYFVYWDDVDFMYRVMKAGLTMCYLPQCRMWHKVGSLTTAAPSQLWIRVSTRNRIYFIRKHFRKPLAIVWILLYRAYLFFRYVFRKDSKDHWSIKEASINDGARLANN
jgi:GT2 family glycosyltransferase